MYVFSRLDRTTLLLAVAALSTPLAAQGLPGSSSSAVLKLKAPAEATVHIDNTDYGQQRRFVFLNLKPDHHWAWQLQVTLPGGQTVQRSVTLRPGHMLCLAVKTDRVGRPHLVNQDVLDLLEEGLIEVKARGAGVDAAHIQLRRLTPYTLSTSVSAGTMLSPYVSTVQNMVVTETTSVSLTGAGWRTIFVSAACANMARSIPASNHHFRLRRTTDPDLARLVEVIQRYKPGFAARQAAVWIALDNPDFNSLGLLRQQAFGLGSFRAINELSAALAMKLCDEAGIDVTRKAIWRDRYRILKALDRGPVKRWLEKKTGSRSWTGYSAAANQRFRRAEAYALIER